MQAREQEDHHDKRDDIDPEAEREATGGNEQAGHAGREDPQQVVLRRVERDCVADRGPVHDAGDHRLARRHLEREGDAEQERQDEDVPVLDHAQRRQHGEDQAEDGTRAVGEDEQSSPIHAIGEDAGEHREEQRGQPGHGAGEPEERW